LASVLDFQPSLRMSGLESSGGVAMAIKRHRNKLSRNTSEAAWMNNIIQMLNVKM
jgi:hypothetical protein